MRAAHSVDSDYDFDQVLRGQFRKDGSLLRDKARVAVEAVLDPFVTNLLRDECSHSSRIEGLKFLADLGDAMPKKNEVAVPGAGFSIVLNLSNATPPTGSNPSDGGLKVIDVTPQAVLDIDPPLASLDGLPEYERINNDLKAGVE